MIVAKSHEADAVMIQTSSNASAGTGYTPSTSGQTMRNELW